MQPSASMMKFWRWRWLDGIASDWLEPSLSPIKRARVTGKGRDVVHVGDIGMSRATDAEIVGWAGITVGYPGSPGRFERDHACVTLLSVWPQITGALSRCLDSMTSFGVMYLEIRPSIAQ